MTLHFFNGVTLTLYESLLIFFTYGFLGWCAEVAFATLKTGAFSTAPSAPFTASAW